MMRVAIIDDSKSSVTLMAELISELRDAEPIPFLSSSLAVKWLGENTVDLIIVDYMMPAPDGLAFLEWFRKDPRHQMVPVIMVTSSDLRNVRHMALQLGATDFLTKPVDPVEFIARTGNALDSFKAHKALADQSEMLAREVARATYDLVEREREALLFLARTAEHRDPETGAHLIRMSAYSGLIATNLGLSMAEADRIKTASPLHDVGKVAIPDQILLKPGRLTDEEMDVMRGHARHGAEILSGSNSPLLRLACDIALSHHEWFDGSGYPQQVKGADIPLAGRIVAVADVFDALTTVRPYKRPWPFEDAYKYVMKSGGIQFDPECLSAFQKSIPDVREIYEQYKETDCLEKGHPDHGANCLSASRRFLGNDVGRPGRGVP
jgi:putative two-component system response regulator